MGTTLTPAQTGDPGMDATLKTMLPSVMRTVVPLIVGFLLTQLARIGLHLDQGAQDGLSAFVWGLTEVVLTAAYYTAMRWLEQKFPQLSILLGWISSPAVYAKNPAAAAGVIAGNATAVQALANTLNNPAVVYKHVSGTAGDLNVGPTVVEKHAVVEALSYAPGFVPAHRKETT